MRTLAITAQNAAGLDQSGIVCHDVRNPDQRNEIFVRKGSPLTAEQLRSLIERGVAELHVAVPDAGDMKEDAAAQRLAHAVAGPGIGLDEPHFGQVTFRATGRGVLRVDRGALTRVNDFEGVLLLTAEPSRPVDIDMTLGVVKCAPLFLSERTVQAVEALPDPVLHLQQFRPLRVGLLAPLDRLRGGAFERARSALAGALDWYGSSFETVIGAEATTDDLASGYRQIAVNGADLILAAGASGTDPLDVVFEGLRRAGGEVTQIGIPAEPGTACWIGHLQGLPVLGLASCELFGQPGALDLLLPALHTGAVLDAQLVRDLALGGLLMGPTRVAPYHARSQDAD